MSIMPGYPVPRAQWASSGEACTACGKRFSFFTSKENCPCCGRLFCSACLSAECTLTAMGLPTAICLDCFQRIQDWRRSNRDQRREAKAAVAPAPPSEGPSPAAVPAAEAELARAEEELDKLRASGRQLRQENDALVDLLAAKDACLAEMSEERAKAAASLEVLTESSERTQQQLRSATAAQASATTALSEVQAKLSASQEANDAMAEKMDVLLEANAFMKSRIAELEEAATQQGGLAAAQETADLQQRCAAAEATAAKSQRDVEELTSALASALQAKTQLQRECDGAAARTRDAEAQLTALREGEEAWRQKDAEQQREMEGIRAALTATHTNLHALQEEQQNAATALRSSAAAQLAEKQQEASALREQVEQLQARVKQLEATESASSAKLDAAQRLCAETEEQREHMATDLRRAQAAEEEWRTVSARNAAKVEELEEALRAATAAAAAAQQRKDAAAAEQQSERESQLLEKQQRIDALAAEVQEVQTTAAKLRSDLSTLEGRHREEREARTAAEALAASLQERVKAHSEAAAAWEAERAARGDEVYQLKSALYKADRQLTALQQQQQSAETDTLLSSTAAQLRDSEQRAEALARQLDSLRSALSGLQSEKETLEGQLQHERELRTAAEQRSVSLQEKAARHEAAAAGAAERLAKVEDALQVSKQQRDAAAEAERGAAAAELAESRRAAESLRGQLEAAGAAARAEVASWREQLEQAAAKASAESTAALATVTEESRTRLQEERERSSQLSAQLADRDSELAEMRRSSLATAKAAKDEIEDLRRHWAEAKRTYETEREAWQASLSELRLAIASLEQQQQNGGADALGQPAAEASRPSAASPAVLSSPSAARGCAPSRWARPTRVAALRVAEDSVRLDDISPVAGLDDWSFDTMAEAARAATPDALVRIGYQIALEWLLFPNRAAMQRWVNVLHTAQLNYAANPYHNRVHAADILQGVFALVSKCPGLLAHMTTTEKRAVVFAAAVHDLRHPGRSEGFLKQTFDATYVLYNGCRVLEQMHTATAFQLLGAADLDFTEGVMDDAEALRFHGIVAELIAGTYMGSHHALMQTWSRPLREGGAYDFAKESDRLAVLCMLLHGADIGAQSRGVPVALQWLGVVEEMCEQGDEEAARGLPVSPGCSRGGDVERGQLFFMETFVVPVFDLIHQLFPAVAAPLENLRALHAHYCRAVHDASRPFPSPVEYRAEAAPAAAATQADEAERRDTLLSRREAAIAKSERAVEQAVQRLREATAAVAQREAKVAERETRRAAESTQPAAAAAEEELLRAVSAVVEREAAVQRKAAEVARLTEEMEEREAVTSRLSVQLATIAERVNQRRQQLRYREARLRARELAQAAGHTAADAATAPPGLEALPTSKALAERSQRSLPSAYRTVEQVRLQSALEKLSSAMSFM